jgi:hypothetical protein
MAVHRIRSSVAKFVVAAGLAASLLAGSTALLAPNEASAATNNCKMMVYYANKADAAKGAEFERLWRKVLYYSDHCQTR